MNYNYEGKKIFYRDVGEGEVIVLLPGNTSSSEVHRGDIDYFSKQYRVICPDYIGYGKSERANELPENFWHENALMLINLMEALKVDKYKVIGSSGGGLIGLNMAILAPDRIQLVVADSLIGEYITKSVGEKIVRGRAQTDNGIKDFWRYAHGDDWEQVIKFDTEMIAQFSQNGRSIFNGKLDKINCPVLIIGSLSDDLIPNIVINMGEICKQIKNSKLLLYSKGRHPVMLTMAEAYRKDVKDFLDRF
ncbi:alpha/beta fold hydrolase [Wukongibacter sp. M2B1]|uniref:alpha/beta fold hydrolase n=1 Tax=Wukongibacter sp. M2B1 TaxID=3088895 RepID=UPI003D78FE40